MPYATEGGGPSLALLSVTVGAEAPPAVPEKPLETSSLLGRAPARWVEFGKFRVQFEKTSLNEVKNAISVGVIVETERESYLCYTALNEGIDSRVWLVSDIDMGTPDRLVTRFTAVRLTNGRASPHCPALPTSIEPVGLPRSIWLNSSDDDLARYVGPLSPRTGDWRSYRFHTKVPGACEGGYDVTNWMETKSDRFGVAVIHIGQITSC